jgi:hypothetical protein
MYLYMAGNMSVVMGSAKWEYVRMCDLLHMLPYLHTPVRQKYVHVSRNNCNASKSKIGL